MPIRTTARVLAVRAAFEIASIAGRWPRLALGIARLTHHGVPLDARTDVVIEGFPRSGNWPAVAALTRSFPGIRIAHHVHAPGHVIAGIRRGLPSLVVIRPPDEAVAALLEIRPVTGSQGYRAFARFYRPLLRHRGAITVATAGELERDDDTVIERFARASGWRAAPSGDPGRAGGETAESLRSRSAPGGLPVLGGRSSGGRPSPTASHGASPRSRRAAERLYETFVADVPG